MGGALWTATMYVGLILMILAFYVLPALAITAGIVIFFKKPAWKKPGIALIAAGVLVLALVFGNHLHNYLLGVWP